MFPSSGRVKLNRVVLKDVIGLQLVPRKRRTCASRTTADLSGTPQNTEYRQRGMDNPITVTSKLVLPCSADQMVPETVTDTSHDSPEGDTQQNSPSLPRCEGMQLPKKSSSFKCKGRPAAERDLEMKQQGPFTRGKYYQSKPNTRSRSRLDKLRRPSCSLRLRFAWCLCNDSATVLVKGKEVQRRINRKPLQKSRTVKGAVQSAIDSPTRSKAPFCRASSLGKLSGRTQVRTLVGCRLRQGNSRKTSMSCAEKAKEGGREGQSKGKARSTGCDLLNTAAAEPGRVLTGTQLLPTGLPNVYRKGNACPKPPGLAGSEGSVRRVLKTSSCALCGDCEKIPSQWKSTSPGPGQPRVQYQTKKANTVIQTPEKIIIWVGKYPTVKLCDIAQIIDVCRQDCGYVLPDVLKTKVVHCFKQDLKAGVQFGRSYSGCGKPANGKNTLAKSSDLYHNVHSKKSARQPQSLIKSQKKNMKENPTAETFTNHTTCPFLESWTTEASANCSASFLLGKHTSKGECRTGMLDRDIEEDPGAGSDIIAAERREVKRIKLGDSIRDGILPSSADIESISHYKPSEADTRDKKKESRMSVSSQSCLDSRAWSTVDMHVNKSDADKKSGGHNYDPGKDGAAQRSSEPFSQKNGVGHHTDNTDQLEQFSCQRTKVYFKQIYLSCARTHMPWPFPRSDLTPVTSAGSDACRVACVYPFPRNYTTTVNQNQDSSCSPNKQTNAMLPNRTSDSSPGPSHKVSSHRKYEKGEDVQKGRKEDGGRILSEKNGKGSGNQFQVVQKPLVSLSSEVAAFSPPREQRGPDMGTVPSSPSDRSETDQHLSTSSSSTPSLVHLNDWQTATASSPMLSSFAPNDSDTLSCTPSPVPHSFPLSKVKGVNSVQTPLTSSYSPRHMVETSLFYHETHMNSPRYTQSCTPPHNSDSFHSCDSSLILSQEEQETEEDVLAGSRFLKPDKHYHPSPSDSDFVSVIGKGSSLLNSPTERWLEIGINMFMPPPVLSPIASPQRHSITNLWPQTPGYSEKGQGDEEDKEQSESDMLSGNQMPKMAIGTTSTLAFSVGHGNTEDFKDGNWQQKEEVTNEELEQGSPDFRIKASPTTGALRETQSPDSDDEDVSDGYEEDNNYDKDYNEAVEQGNRNVEQVSSNPKMHATLTTDVLTEPPSSSSDEDDGSCSDEGQLQSSGEERTAPSDTSTSEREEAEAEAADDSDVYLLDEFTAYEQDILIVDVIQEDPDLFVNLPMKSLLKQGPRISEASQTRTIADVKIPSSLETEQRFTKLCSIKPLPQLPAHIKEEESNKRPWRPQSSYTPSKVRSSSWPPIDNQPETMDEPDANNNNVNDGFERNQVIQTVGSVHNTIPPLMAIGSGPWIKNPANMTDLRRQKNNSYCRLYFSETLSCTFKMCRFQHVPIEGDEKFCVETVTRFTQNPMCLQKAGAVFTGYYQNNPPGVYFSKPVLLSLLWALLKAGFLSTIFSVLNVSLAHKIMPGPEFLLALFNFVRERGLMCFVPELLQLTAKMADAGLVLSLDYIELQKTQEFQQTVHLNSSVQMSGNHKLLPSTSAPFPETLNLAHAIVEIELCTKQEDWRRMGVVFRSICQSNQVPNKLELVSSRVAVALLSETKDKLSLPFAAFAEMVCQSEGEDSLTRSHLGRIGVSLMFRYHKTHQWAKGRRVVEALSKAKVSYSKLKGLFGNEDGASRCCLVSMATELFLLTGSVEGALNTLRDNEWFISSRSWPCEPRDLEKRSHVLTRLAEKTSHRDTLEILSNLPGLKEPSDLVDCSKYSPLLNAHLQVCVERQTLPVASDTVDFMFSKNLAVNPTVLQTLLHKLGKQNLWLRAREVFRHALCVGYYPGVLAPPGFLALTVPCRLGEIEMALTFEMFITVNATVILGVTESTSSLSITLKRTQTCEREYLSAGSRLLSAACIPQPQLAVRYTAVNSSREQVFTLDTSSARRWLRHNHLWANEVWTHSSKQ